MLDRKEIILNRDRALAVLMIEGRRGSHPSFSDELDGRNYILSCASSGREGIAILEESNPGVVVVDAASLRTSGVRICQSFRKVDNTLPIILIVEREVSLPDVVDANLILKLPFTSQKLINRLQAYQKTDNRFVIQVGPIVLNTKTQLVTCHDRQSKLTPRLVEILKMLMENHGKVVERMPLFKKIWKTNYTGDTRTLDVHISWLRQAVEEDSGNPQYIITKRGVGYKLDI
jgi:DNA-binding response OmpR family regulator